MVTGVYGKALAVRAGRSMGKAHIKAGHLLPGGEQWLQEARAHDKAGHLCRVVSGVSTSGYRSEGS